MTSLPLFVGLEADEKKDGLERFAAENHETIQVLDRLGLQQLEILAGFTSFCDLAEKIQNRPEVKDISLDDNLFPKYNCETFEDIALQAEYVLNKVKHDSVGITAKYAATNSGFKDGSENPTEDALLVGNVIESLKKDLSQGETGEASAKEVNQLVSFLFILKHTAIQYRTDLNLTNETYTEYLEKLRDLVLKKNKTDWDSFTEEERLLTQRTTLLIQLLYKMCTLNLVNRLDSDDKMNELNIKELGDTEEALDQAIKYVQ